MTPRKPQVPMMTEAEIVLAQDDALRAFRWKVRDARNDLERELRAEAIRLFGHTVGSEIIL